MLAKRPRCMQINLYANQLVCETTGFQDDDQRYLGQFVSEMFDSSQCDSTRGSPQCELKPFMLPWQHAGFQASPMLKAFLATLSALYGCMIQQANMLGQVQSPCLMFFELKITKNHIEVRLKGTGKELPVGVLHKNY